MIYKRVGDSEIFWQPNDQTLAKETMVDIVGEVGVEIDSEQASDVREEYKARHVDKHGKDSPFYEDYS